MESQSVLIHVRFAPNGSVVEISERPTALSPQEWFNFLSDKAATSTSRLPAAAACFG